MPEIAPRQLILTLYGLYARDEHNWLSVASVVKLLSDLDVDPAGVRSSISRLKRRGVLESLKVGRTAGYCLSPGALELLREGDVRIFSHPRARLADGFVLVVFSIPESERDRRHALRSTLAEMGFGTASPGVWVAPGTLHEHTVRTIERMGLTDYVDLFVAQHRAFGDLRERVAEWWDLDAIESEYNEFVCRFQDAPKRFAAAADGPKTAFEIYVPMLTEWRRLPYRDPGLPLELLPDGWIGSRAEDLFADLDALLRRPAREHALRTIHS
ncbi:PaaX family transcriptional regulator C-terminal domain-containing protein [Planotetraspora phitsanulokensis]|uniref:PaaX family transcriptional regulator n=1 Tax=Planotetraspora phitsanulokensis TaxID=575192 RepID=A0A8J3XGQ3_9ACTN|nr:PaaX family transcriptional regulator C-terminal domain-containing protein [Planotetraspora phitsanulokensis]GII35778.1 PaaX family transcriptional regulator [Planotetraspora phitsanulokensis]